MGFSEHLTWGLFNYVIALDDKEVYEIWKNVCIRLYVRLMYTLVLDFQATLWWQFWALMFEMYLN